MANVKLTDPLLDRMGNQVVERFQADANSEIQESKIVLRDVLLRVVDTPLQGSDENMDSTSKLRLFRLGQKIALQDECEFTAPEVTLLLDRANKVFINPAIYGRIVEALDPATLKE